MYIRALYLTGNKSLVTTGNIRALIWDSKKPVAQGVPTIGDDMLLLYSAQISSPGQLVWSPPECERVYMNDGELPLGPEFSVGMRVQLIDDSTGSVVTSADGQVMRLLVEYVQKTC